MKQGCRSTRAPTPRSHDMYDPLTYEDVSLGELEPYLLGKLKGWRNDWAVRSTTREFKVITALQEEDWYKSLQGQKYPEHLMFAIRHHGEAVGVCGLTYIDWKNRHAEVSIYIGEVEWKEKGIGGKALRCLCQYAFRELGFLSLWAEIFEGNEVSANLFARGGFVKAGFLHKRLWRDGRARGSYFYEMTDEDWQSYVQQEGLK